MFKIHSLFSWIRSFRKTFTTLNTIQISRGAILDNFDVFQALHPNWDIFPVLKSNAYGHGIQEVARILTARSPRYIVVDSYYEALKIWEVSNTRVLLIGYTLPQNLPYMDLRRIALTVYDIDTLHELGKIGKSVRIHLKIDTGMHRQGIRPEDIPVFLEHIRQYPHIQLEGVCTHFADADAVENGYSNMQEQIFRECVEKIRSYGFAPRYIHADNSAASTKSFGKDFCNGLRLGISLYGVNPLESGDPSHPILATLRPALTFRSTLILKKPLKKGEKVSYNGTFIAVRDMTIGVIPVGYYEGLSRKLSSNYEVYFHETPMPILGRVCMNLSVIDISGVDIEQGDPVEIISYNPQKGNSIYAMAKKSETIPYESLVKLAESVRREIVE